MSRSKYLLSLVNKDKNKKTTGALKFHDFLGRRRHDQEEGGDAASTVANCELVSEYYHILRFFLKIFDIFEIV